MRIEILRCLIICLLYFAVIMYKDSLAQKAIQNIVDNCMNKKKNILKLQKICLWNPHSESSIVPFCLPHESGIPFATRRSNVKYNAMENNDACGTQDTRTYAAALLQTRALNVKCELKLTICKLRCVRMPVGERGRSNDSNRKFPSQSEDRM